MVTRAMKHSDNTSKDAVKDLLSEFKDIFRTKLGKDPPVDVPPMEIEFEGSTRPVKVRQRLTCLRNLHFPQLCNDENGIIYIPSNNQELQLRIAVSAHHGLGGHRGYIATCSIIKENMYWENMEEDIKAFLQGCLVCRLSESGEKIRGPLGSQIHASKVSELLHLDYLYVGDSSNQE